MAIGHVIPMSRNNEMVNPVFADFIAGAGEVDARNGYDMVLCMVPDGDEARACAQLADAGSVDGLIVHGPRVDDPRIAMLRGHGLPFVVHGRAPGLAEDYAFVDIASARAFLRATNLLLDLGHRRIALLNGLGSLDFARRRRAGLEDAMAARAIPVRADLLGAAQMMERAGFDAAARMLAAPYPPTAIPAASYIMGLGIDRAVRAAGLAAGRHVSIVIHDDVLSYLGNGSDMPIYTATRSSVPAAGRRCAEILLDRVARPDAPVVQEVWECDLVLGHSTGPVPA